jgi:hypothetical protein
VTTWCLHLRLLPGSMPARCPAGRRGGFVSSSSSRSSSSSSSSLGASACLACHDTHPRSPKWRPPGLGSSLPKKSQMGRGVGRQGRGNFLHKHYQPHEHPRQVQSARTKAASALAVSGRFFSRATASAVSPSAAVAVKSMSRQSRRAAQQQAGHQHMYTSVERTRATRAACKQG